MGRAQARRAGSPPRPGPPPAAPSPRRTPHTAHAATRSAPIGSLIIGAARAGRARPPAHDRLPGPPAAPPWGALAGVRRGLRWREGGGGHRVLGQPGARAPRTGRADPRVAAD